MNKKTAITSKAPVPTSVCFSILMTGLTWMHKFSICLSNFYSDMRIQKCTYFSWRIILKFVIGNQEANETYPVIWDSAFVSAYMHVALVRQKLLITNQSHLALFLVPYMSPIICHEPESARRKAIKM